MNDRINRTAEALHITPQELRQAMRVAGLIPITQPAPTLISADDLDTLASAGYLLAATETSQARDVVLTALSNLGWWMTLLGAQAPHPTEERNA